MVNKLIVKKMKRKLFTIIISVGLLSIGIFTEFFSNIWLELTGRGYFIPTESNIFIFKPTKWNDGSGEWWLYGEDNKYYYGMNIDEDTKFLPKYYKILKTDTDINFNKYNYKTWTNKKLE